MTFHPSRSFPDPLAPLCRTGQQWTQVLHGGSSALRNNPESQPQNRIHIAEVTAQGEKNIKETC
jgi:hypothetical protein